MTGKDPDSPSRGGPRWVKAALVVSLCVNVLVLGAVGGFMMRQEQDDFGRVAFRHVIRALPDERREEARDLLEARVPEFRELREEIRAARRETMALLTADPVDQAALRASVERARELTAQRRVLVEDALLEFAANLPAAERRDLADRLAEKREKWRERREKWRESREESD